jgi:hypothetical protein
MSIKNKNKKTMATTAIIALAVMCMMGNQSVSAFKDIFSNPPGYDDGFYMGCGSIQDHGYDYALGFKDTNYYNHQSELFHAGYSQAFKDCATYNSHTGHYEFKNWNHDKYLSDGEKADTGHHHYKNYAEEGKALDQDNDDQTQGQDQPQGQNDDNKTH